MRAAIAILIGLMSLPLCAQDITGDLNTNIGDGANVDSNNTSNSTTFNGPQGVMSNPVPTAMAPSMIGGGGNESCLIAKSRGVQITIFGVAEGGMVQDPECNRRRDAKTLGLPQQVGGLGLQVAGISRMCGDPDVFLAMLKANTPCPIPDIENGTLAIGRRAIELYRSNPDAFVIGYRQNKAIYDALLWIGKELPDVTNNDDKPTLSERFRTRGRRNLQQSEPSGTSGHGSDQSVAGSDGGG